MATTTSDTTRIARRFFARLNFEVKGPFYGSPVIEVRAIGVGSREVTVGSGLDAVPAGGWIDFDPFAHFTEEALVAIDETGGSLHIDPNDISYRTAVREFGAGN